jgi:hypothetical protein
VAAGLEIILNPMFLCGFPPRAAPQVQRRQASLPGLNKGGNEKIFCKEHTRAAHFPAWGRRFNPSLRKSFRGLAYF